MKAAHWPGTAGAEPVTWHEPFFTRFTFTLPPVRLILHDLPPEVTDQLIALPRLVRAVVGASMSLAPTRYTPDAAGFTEAV